MNQVTSNVVAAFTTFLLAVNLLFSKAYFEQFLPEWLIISFILLSFGSCVMNIIYGVRHFKNDN